MNSSELFEIAVRNKFRYAVVSGAALSTEDLYDLPLNSARGVSLNSLAVEFHKALQETSISFVDTPKATDVSLQQRFEIIKHVISVRVQERDTAASAKEVAEKKQKLLGLIAQKQDANLAEMSLEDLQASLEAL
jgi:hypothetical protein